MDSHPLLLPSERDHIPGPGRPTATEWGEDGHRSRRRAEPQSESGLRQSLTPNQSPEPIADRIVMLDGTGRAAAPAHMVKLIDNSFSDRIRIIKVAYIQRSRIQ